jgi:hypothetical protein
MNSQEYHSLQEAYMNVYQEVDEAVYGGTPKKPEEPKDKRLLVTNADKKGNTPAYQNLMRGDKRYKAADHMDEATAMAKRNLNEPAIRLQIAANTQGGKSADRAKALADKPTYGNDNADMQRRRYARSQMGTHRQTTSSNPGLHGYSHKSNDPKVRALQAARGAQRGSATLTPNERNQLNMSYDLYDTILEYLISEGYADTNENALVIMANMSEEWRDSIVEVTGRGRIDPIGNASDYGAGVGERGSRTPKDAGLRMSPVDRAKARVIALRKRENPEATRRANRIDSRFVNPTDRNLDRSMLAANNQKIATARRLRQQQQDQT